MTSKTATTEARLKEKDETLRRTAGEDGATAEELAGALGIDIRPKADRTLFTTAIGKMGFRNKKVGGEGRTIRRLWHESFPQTARVARGPQGYSPCSDRTQNHIWVDTGGGWDHCVKPGCGIFRMPDGSPMPR